MAFNQNFFHDTNHATYNNPGNAYPEQQSLSQSNVHSTQQQTDLSYSYATSNSLNSWVLFSPSTKDGELENRDDILSSSYAADTDSGMSRLDHDRSTDEDFPQHFDRERNHKDAKDEIDDDEDDSLIDSLRFTDAYHATAQGDHLGDINSKIDQWEDGQGNILQAAEDEEENIASWDFSNEGMANQRNGSSHVLARNSLFKTRFYGDDLFDNCDADDLKKFQKTSKQLSNSLKRSPTSTDLKLDNEQAFSSSGSNSHIHNHNSHQKRKRFDLSKQLATNRQCYSQILTNKFNDINVNSTNLNTYLNQIFLKVPQNPPSFSMLTSTAISKKNNEHFWDQDLNNDRISSISSSYSLSTNSAMFGSPAWGEVN